MQILLVSDIKRIALLPFDRYHAQRYQTTKCHDRSLKQKSIFLSKKGENNWLGSCWILSAIKRLQCKSKFKVFQRTWIARFIWVLSLFTWYLVIRRYDGRNGIFYCNKRYLTDNHFLRVLIITISFSKLQKF